MEATVFFNQPKLRSDNPLFLSDSSELSCSVQPVLLGREFRQGTGGRRGPLVCLLDPNPLGEMGVGPSSQLGMELGEGRPRGSRRGQQREQRVSVKRKHTRKGKEPGRMGTGKWRGKGTGEVE